MTSDITQIIPAHDRCQDCHRRTATKLCDFVLGQTGVTFYRDYQKFKNQNMKPITCDRLLCDSCANKMYGMDFCKNHCKNTGGRR